MPPTPVAQVRVALERIMLGVTPKTVTFQYTSAKGEKSSRHAEPYELTQTELKAFCLEKQEIRRFKLEGIADVAEGETFTPKWPIKV